MGSCFSAFVNIIQILSFAVQLLQAGPDMMSRVPRFVDDVCARLRAMMGKSMGCVYIRSKADGACSQQESVTMLSHLRKDASKGSKL
jgi:hypothetical protein